jgi:dimethylhistidine N-methyltransferase
MQVAAISKNKTAFYKDVMEGLRSIPKYLHSKYFYDASGDKLFQEIMQSDEYYLTKCEMEIMQRRAGAIAEAIYDYQNDFDVVELGAGDCSKSIYLLEQVFKRNREFIFYPIDISSNVIDLLEAGLPERLPGLQVRGLNGEYLPMLEEVSAISSRKKLVLFMGSNIGNMTVKESIEFCKKVKRCLSTGDLLLIGFDLKKDPQLILKAYNDRKGITREFNLNLLKRINRELNANFVSDQFKHFPVYNPESGECRSYLVSSCRQRILIGDTEYIDFEENETIHMEISTKYSVKQTDEMAILSGFTPVQHFYDSRKWFLDAVWECK